jgi:hypothetical protein
VEAAGACNSDGFAETADHSFSSSRGLTSLRVPRSAVPIALGSEVVVEAREGVGLHGVAPDVGALDTDASA